MEELFVRRRYWVIYLLVYVLVAGLLLGLHWGELAEAAPLDRMVAMAAILAVSAGIAAMAAILLELGGWLVMLLIPETIKRIKQKTREETNAEWEAWFAKYRDAQTNGREFTEPTPSARKGS